MLVPRMVAMWRPILKRRLMMFLATELLWESQMSTQITTLSDLGDALMTQGFEANVVSLKRCISLRTLLMKSEVIIPDSELRGSPMIFM